MSAVNLLTASHLVLMCRMQVRVIEVVDGGTVAVLRTDDFREVSLSSSSTLCV